MLPTPSTAHVDISKVYDPSEDSFLLLDSLSSPSEKNFFRERFPQFSLVPLILEVGTGSGVITAFLTTYADVVFGRRDVITLGTDLSVCACSASTKTIGQSSKPEKTNVAGEEGSEDAKSRVGCFFDCIAADLVSAVRPHSVDILVFNPPYVPSEKVPPLNEDSDRAENLAWESSHLAVATEGGVDGMEVTDRLLEQLPETLSWRGVAYILLCARNRPSSVVQRIRQWGHPWEAELIFESKGKGGWERLFIMRVSRATPV